MDMFKKASAAASKVAGQVKKDVIEDKNIWKTLGYVAGGVGAVAALPVLGTVGAVSGAGAVVGVVGGLVAKSIFDNEAASSTEACFAETEMNSERATTSQVDISAETQARKDQAFAEFHTQLKDYASKSSEMDYEELLLALTAVAVATANVEDGISEAERKEIVEFAEVIKASKMSQNKKNYIANFLNTPPDVRDAFQLAQNVPNCDPAIFRNMIIIVGSCDDCFSEKEQQLLNTWDIMN